MSRSLPAEQRLTLCVSAAALLHAAVVLGIRFDYEEHPDAALPSLDVILVQTRSDEAPEQAAYLAQAHQRGGGESDTRERPSELFTSAVPKPEAGIAPHPVQASAPPTQPREQDRTELLTQREAALQVNPDVRLQPQPETTQRPDPNRLDRDLEMARLAASVSAKRQVYADRPKLKFLTANTREHEYAAYMFGWAAKIERVGNLNYPPEARQRALFGEVLLAVRVRRDGTVDSIRVMRSSGEPVLDDAAEQIVRMAAPFPPIPNAATTEFDMLDITRTWRFLPGNVLRSD